MPCEWRDRFNSFNSEKAYLYGEYYQAVADWLNHKRDKPLPPLSVSFDPIHTCNLMCDHCNAHRYLDHFRMSDKHILELIQFLAKWGVKSACIGGGGEPTLHTKLGEALLLAAELGLETSLVTNGTLLTPELINISSKYCRFIGISVDSATRETFKIGRKKDLFDTVIVNIRKLVEAVKHSHSKCTLCFKFLIFGYNQHEIFAACKLAKELGVDDFHCRPADFRHQGMGELKKQHSEYKLDLIHEEFKKCHEIENEHFRAYTVVHKFNEDFIPKKNFRQCYASPLVIQICADGNIYYCPDTRFLDLYSLGKHEPVSEILKNWGNEHHRQMVKYFAAINCFSRCTYTFPNEICERLFINQDDPMYRNFI